MPLYSSSNAVCTGHPLICPATCRGDTGVDSAEVFRADLACQQLPTEFEPFCSGTVHGPFEGSTGQSHHRFGPPESRLRHNGALHGHRPDAARQFHNGDAALYDGCPPVPGKARPMPSSAFPVNGHCPPLSGDLQRGFDWCPTSALPMNDHCPTLTKDVRPMSDHSTNRVQTGSDQCPTFCGYVWPRYDRGTTMVRPRNDDCPTNVRPGYNQCPTGVQSPTFNQPGPGVHCQHQSASINGQPGTSEVQCEGISREVGERPEPDDPGEAMENGLTSRRHSAPTERNPHSPEKRHRRSAGNQRKISRRRVTKTKQRHDSSPSSSSSSNSRSGSRNHRRGYGATGNGSDKKPTKDPDKPANDDNGRKSENGAEVGKDPPEKSSRRDPADDSSSDEDDQDQPATPAATETKRINASGSDKHLGKYDGTSCLETFLARYDRFAKYLHFRRRKTGYSTYPSVW